MPVSRAKPEPRYWATCVVEGVFLPYRGELIASDGHVYPAHQAASHRRWSERHPDDAMEARLHLAWPRTTAEGVELTLVNSYLPTDPHFEAQEHRINRASLSGAITNQKANKGLFVLRVMRNAPAPKGKHLWAQFRPHLLFIHGLVQPLSAHLNRVVRLDCRLEHGHLVLDSVASIGESLEEVLEVGGIRWPWPFTNNAASIKRLAELNPDPQGDWIPLRQDYRDTLTQLLENVTRHSRKLGHNADPALARNLDRIRKICSRITSICRFAEDADLRGMLKRTKLLQLLNSFQPDLAAARKMTAPALLDSQKSSPSPATSSEAKSPGESKQGRGGPATRKPKAVDLPEALEPLAELLLRKYPDDLLQLGCNLTAGQLRHAVQQLVACGWYDALRPDQQALIASYQLKKVIRLRG